MTFPMIVFCGKGGVGKTTMSLSLGLWYANQGLRVVVVTSHPLPELAVSVSLHGLKEQYPKAAANLFIIHIDPREILANKVRQQVPSEFLVKAILSSRIYQSLIEVAPGLKEIAFLARLRQLAMSHSEASGVGAFERLIWDAPATGHFLQTMKVSTQFDSYLSGPFALVGQETMKYFADRSNMRLFPVTALEDMAVEETIELCEKLESDLGIHPEAVLCNLASPLLCAPDSVFAEISNGINSTPGAKDLKFVLDRHGIERELYNKLTRTVSTDLHILERKPSWKSDLDLLVGLAAKVGCIFAEEAQ